MHALWSIGITREPDGEQASGWPIRRPLIISPALEIPRRRAEPLERYSAMKRRRTLRNYHWDVTHVPTSASAVAFMFLAGGRKCA